MSSNSVLIIEDEDNLLEALRYTLTRNGYEVLTASDGESGLECARTMTPNLIILDIMLPKLDGFEICRIIRQESEVPILILTAKGEEMDRVVGLELGADDYVVKPFSMRELLSRIRALLRRSHSNTSISRFGSDKIIKAGALAINLSSHSVTLRGSSINLKPKEFDLLALLAQNEGKAFTRNDILDLIWGPNYIGDYRTVDVHIHGLRRKIESDPNHPSLISTIRGVGYRFEA